MLSHVAVTYSSRGLPLPPGVGDVVTDCRLTERRAGESAGQGAPAPGSRGFEMNSQWGQRSEGPLGGTPHTRAIRTRTLVFPRAASPETNRELRVQSPSQARGRGTRPWAAAEAGDPGSEHGRPAQRQAGLVWPPGPVGCPAAQRAGVALSLRVSVTGEPPPHGARSRGR